MSTEKTEDELLHSQHLEQQAQAAARDRAARAAGLRLSRRPTAAAENPVQSGGVPPETRAAASPQTPTARLRIQVRQWAKDVIEYVLKTVAEYVLKTVGLLALVMVPIVVVLIGFTAYESLDSAGWITHNHDTPVWIQGDWLVGEYRECDMQTATPVVEGKQYDADDLKSLPRLFCARQPHGFYGWSEMTDGDVNWQANGGDFHTLSVSYFGRIARPDRWLISWRCQRKSESLVCYALT